MTAKLVCDRLNITNCVLFENSNLAGGSRHRNTGFNIRMLDCSVGNHRISDFYKAGDVGSGYVVHVSAGQFRSVGDTFLMDILHDIE